MLSSTLVFRSGYRTRGWATRAAGYRAAISCHGASRHFAAATQQSGRFLSEADIIRVGKIG